MEVQLLYTEQLVSNCKMKLLRYIVLLCVSSRSNQDAYDTNKMAEEFTHFFLDQAFSVGQQVQAGVL